MPVVIHAKTRVAVLKRPAKILRMEKPKIEIVPEIHACHPEIVTQHRVPIMVLTMPPLDPRIIGLDRARGDIFAVLQLDAGTDNVLPGDERQVGIEILRNLRKFDLPKERLRSTLPFRQK